MLCCRARLSQRRKVQLAGHTEIIHSLPRHKTLLIFPLEHSKPFLALTQICGRPRCSGLMHHHVGIRGHSLQRLDGHADAQQQQNHTSHRSNVLHKVTSSVFWNHCSELQFSFVLLLQCNRVRDFRRGSNGCRNDFTQRQCGRGRGQPQPRWRWRMGRDRRSTRAG